MKTPGWIRALLIPMSLLACVWLLFASDAMAKCKPFYYKTCKQNKDCKAGYTCQKASSAACIPSRCWCDRKTGKRICKKDCYRSGVCQKRQVKLAHTRRRPVSMRKIRRVFRHRLKRSPKKYKERKRSGWVTTTYKRPRRHYHRRPTRRYAPRRYAPRRYRRRGAVLGGVTIESKPTTIPPTAKPSRAVSEPAPPAPSAPRESLDATRARSRGGHRSVRYRPVPRRRAYRRAYKRAYKKRPTRRYRRRPMIAQNPLTAGETDDNKRFDAYLLYHRRHANLLPAHYRMDISERYTFRVTDKDGRNLPNCRIVVTGKDKIIFRGRTDSRGQLLFFPRTSPNAKGIKKFYVSFLHKGKTQVRTFKRARYGTDKPWRIKMSVRKPTKQKVNLDLLFLLDTTGSMSDEIARIQATLLAITRKIRRMKQKPIIRFGMVLYRDRTDAYITRRFPFTTNVNAFNRALRQVRAAGGGDAPEAMNMGLYTAVEQMKWSSNALRLMFLVADAPPHLDYNDDVPYTKTLRSAIAKGIKIFPTAASGLDARGSYIYRQIAQYTQAKFLFIKYNRNTAGRHGITGPTASNNLDDIILRIVRTEVSQYAK